jgi:error-prone DNA polymerase
MGDRAHPAAHAEEHGRAGGMGTRRVLVHASGFRQSPYADIRPAGEDSRNSRSISRRSGTAGHDGYGDHVPVPEPGHDPRPGAGGTWPAPAAAGPDPAPDAAPQPTGSHRRGTPRKLWHSSQGSSGW